MTRPPLHKRLPVPDQQPCGGRPRLTRPGMPRATEVDPPGVNPALREPPAHRRATAAVVARPHSAQELVKRAHGRAALGGEHGPDRMLADTNIRAGLSGLSGPVRKTLVAVPDRV